jgi:formylmethanofuran dehydrogenase subunit B
MAQLSTTKLSIESFKDQPWIGPLLSMLNGQTSELLAAFKNGLTINENLSQELKELNFTNDSVAFPLRFSLKFNTVPKAVQIVYCLNKTDNVTEAITTLPVWTYANGSVVLSSITGLTSGKNYLLRVHIIYG